jgi:hypothetical protein
MGLWSMNELQQQERYNCTSHASITQFKSAHIMVRAKT